jgi:long-subunit fatty acid transport protein
MFRSGSSISISGQANDKLSFKLPDEMTAGIAHDFADVWKLEADVKWTRWSALKDLHVSTSGVISQSNPLNLRDTLTVMTGVTWTWRQNSQLRAGYAYDQGANRSIGFNPVIADQDGHRISLGAGGDAYGMHMDLAYTYTHYTKKTATGAFAGTYRDRKQAVNFSVSKTFD